MQLENAFAGYAKAPVDRELREALGSGEQQSHWDSLLAALADSHGLTVWEWTSYSPKAGWSVRVKQGKRNIVYLSPQAAGGFFASFALGGRAMAAAGDRKLPAKIRKILETAPHYAEGTAVRVPVQTAADVRSVVELCGIKIAN